MLDNKKELPDISKIGKDMSNEMEKLGIKHPWFISNNKEAKKRGFNNHYEWYIDASKRLGSGNSKWVEQAEKELSLYEKNKEKDKKNTSTEDYESSMKQIIQFYKDYKKNNKDDFKLQDYSYFDPNNKEDQISSAEPLPLVTALSSDIPPVPTIEPEATAERIPDKKTRYSSKKELEKLKKEFEEYKKKVESDFRDIDESLEENFTRLYEQIESLQNNVPSQDEVVKIQSTLEKLTRVINKKDSHKFRNVLAAAKRAIPKNLQNILNPAQVAISKYVSSNIEDDKDEKTYDDGKSPFERSPGLLKRITDKLKETDGKMSIKDVLSTAGKETKSYAKDVFDPLNIARFLTFDSDIAPAMLGKLTGRSKEDIAKFTSETPPDEKDTASKMSGGMDKEYEEMTDTLIQIYDLMKKSKDDDKKQKELEKDFEKSKRDDEEKKHKELLDAIRSIGGGISGGEKEKEDDDSGILGTIMDAASLMGGSKKLKSLRGKITKSASKMGGKLLKAGKSVLGFLEKIPGIQYIAAGAQLLLDVKDAIDEHERGAIDEKEMKKRITESVGSALGGAGGATIGAAIGLAVPVVGSLLGGIAGFMGGEYIGKKAAGALFDFFEGGTDPDQAARKVETARPKAETPTAIPIPPSSVSTPVSTPSAASKSSGSKQLESTSSSVSSVPSAAPTPSPNKGSELNQKVSQNQEMKLAADSPAEPKIINNTSSSSSSSSGSERQPIPPVRTTEDTLGRLSMYATRTV